MPETPTTRLGLYKSDDDGSELVNVQQDLNGNWDKVDLAAGFQIVTSSTRPGTPYAGKGIFESDTARAYLHNGTAPASAGWVQIPTSSGSFNSDLTLADGRDVVIGTRRTRNALSTTTTTVANTAAETVVATMAIPANDAIVGAIYRLEAWGISGVTGTPTFTVQCRLGGIGGASMGSTGAITAGAGTGRSWRAQFDLICATTGAGGTWRPNLALFQNQTAGAGNIGPWHQVNQVAAVSRTTASANDMVITWQWGTANAANTLTCQGVIGQRIA